MDLWVPRQRDSTGPESYPESICFPDPATTALSVGRETVGAQRKLQYVDFYQTETEAPGGLCLS